MTQNYIFVCTGNICRSCMAEGIARKLLGTDSKIQFSSMGTQALVGQNADEKAIAVSEELGVDISLHKARQLNIQELMNAKKVFCMDRGHLEFVSALSPVVAEKTVLLTDFPKSRFIKKDVSDPFRQTIGKFRKSRDLILKELKRVIQLLEE